MADNTEKPFAQATVNLSKLFSNKSTQKSFRLVPADTLTVPDGKAWLIVGGFINHITATASGLLGYRGPTATGNVIFFSSIDLTLLSGSYPLFSNIAATPATQLVAAAQWTLQPLQAGTILLFGGGAGAYLNITVLEFDAI